MHSFSGSFGAGGAGNKWQGKASTASRGRSWPPKNPQQPTSAPPQGAAKRALTPTPAASGVKATTTSANKTQGQGRAAFTVTTVSKKGDVVASTLLGDYEEKGTHHGKKCYQKIGQIPGHPGVKVFLYYFDSRDGQEFSGWWFGDALGGSQVWARAAVHTALPPKVGWRVPWDAPVVQAGALIVDPLSASSSSPAAVALTPAPAIAPAQRLKKATTDVTSAETAANIAISSAKKVIENDKAAESALKLSGESLQKQQTKLTELLSSLNKDIAESRKGGVTAASVIADLAKLLPRVKSLQAAVAVEVGKIKTRQTKATSEKLKVEAEKRKKDSEEKLKQQEEKDSKECQQLVGKTKTALTSVVAAVDALLAKAAPMIAAGEAPEDSLEDVQKAVAEADKKLIDVRAEVNKLVTASKNYAPQAKKAAMAEVQAGQSQIQEGQKKVNAYKHFKKDFQSFVDARTVAAEVSEKIDGVDAAIGKAEKLIVPANISKMSVEEIAAVDALTNPAVEELNGTAALIGQKSKGGSAATQAALAQARSRISEARSKIDSLTSKIKERRQELDMQTAVAKAKDLVEAAEKTLEAVQQAEMPFLKGLEVLPKEDSDRALAESEAAYSTSHKAVTAARTFMTLRLSESRKCANKELAKKIADALPSLGATLDVIDGKLVKFRRETAERKLAAMLAELAAPVVEAEAKVQSLKVASMVLSGNLDETSVDGIKAAMESCTGVEKDAIASCASARQIISSRQNSFKSGEGAQGVSKINNRLSAAQAELNKHKKSIENANKIIKAKQVLEQEGNSLAVAEAEVQKAESLAPGENSDFTEDGLKAMEEASVNAAKTIKSLLAAVQPLVSAAPANTKAGLQKLVDGAKTCLEKLATLKTSTKPQREKALVSFFSKEGEAKVGAVEANVEKMGEAELPFLKGIEVLPLKETQRIIEESEKTIKNTQEGIAQAKSFISAKSSESKSFSKDASQEVVTAFAGLNTRITAAQQKLSSFTKDTAERKKGCQVQEAGEMVAEAEAQAKKALAAAEPFMKEDADKMSDADAWEPFKVYMDLEKEAKQMLEKTRSFLNERQRVSNTVAAHKEILSKLVERLTGAQGDLAKAKAATVTFDKRFLAKRILEEVNEKIGSLDGEVKKAKESCAALLDQGGEVFLVHASIRTLAAALTAHMHHKNLDVNALFAAISKGRKVKSPAFIKYLMGLPAAIEHEEIAFKEERCVAIFNELDSDKDQAVDATEFGGIFRQRLACKKSVPLTDSFSLAECKTIIKIEPGEIIEALGATKTDVDGIVRCEVQTSGDDKKVGWVTIHSNQNTVFFEEIKPYSVFCKDADKSLAEASSNVNKVLSFLSAKSQEGGAASAGTPLADARQEIAKVKATVSNAVATVEALKKQFATAKREYAEKEKLERDAHIHAKYAKEAESITVVAVPAVEEATAAAKAVDDQAAPFTSVDIAEVEAFATPDTVFETVEKLAVVASEKIDAARKIVREQLEVATKVSPPTGASLEAKRVLLAMQARLGDATKSNKKELDTVRSRCKIIANKIFDTVREALRKDVEGSGGDALKLFKTLSGGKPEVSKDAFSTKLTSLAGVSIQPEHAKLVCKRVADSEGGLSRGAFLALVQRYAVVVKDTALTSLFDVNTTQTVRKLDKDEILEVLEGPKKDETLGVERVRVKPLLDSQEGWVTIKGNQGTVFLNDLPKPFYKVQSETTLENDASTSEVIRALPANEIVEVLEGPQKHTFADVTFAKVKATKDGAIGWVTIVDSKGIELVGPNKKLFTCKAIVAITDACDINDSKVLRKLSVGEVFEAAGDVVVDSASGVSRVKGKASKDNVEGWITVKGNAGTSFVQLDAKNFVVNTAVDLLKRFGSAAKGEVTRKLEQGESVLLVEGPKVEKAIPQTRLKVCAQTDLAEGWISKDSRLQPFLQKF